MAKQEQDIDFASIEARMYSHVIDGKPIPKKLTIKEAYGTLDQCVQVQRPTPINKAMGPKRVEEKSSTGVRPLSFEAACKRVTDRFTTEHVPGWAGKVCPNGYYPGPHFGSDREWYNKTEFIGFNTKAARQYIREGKPSYPLGKWLEKPFTQADRTKILVHPSTGEQLLDEPAKVSPTGRLVKSEPEMQPTPRKSLAKINLADQFDEMVPGLGSYPAKKVKTKSGKPVKVEIKKKKPVGKKPVKK